ncbi:unnamed protein product [Bursaphelenchus xylophilus]|uniref:(pine wood nematode) hypothetical protein n=1 Tax=Bursaphelenchus xylophilus TaxID=6326 RepID=A0A1I7SRC9_BURXY|nr:unnamed protein product [Bursaphelenchus xylophilus]CAG9102595.1 unnamed protein product [Bursaphelenchus xylophilus]
MSRRLNRIFLLILLLYGPILTNSWWFFDSEDSLSKKVEELKQEEEETTTSPISETEDDSEDFLKSNRRLKFGIKEHRFNSSLVVDEKEEEVPKLGKEHEIEETPLDPVPDTVETTTEFIPELPTPLPDSSDDELIQLLDRISDNIPETQPEKSASAVEEEPTTESLIIPADISDAEAGLSADEDSETTLTSITQTGVEETTLAPTASLDVEKSQSDEEGPQKTTAVEVEPTTTTEVVEETTTTETTTTTTEATTTTEITTTTTTEITTTTTTQITTTTAEATTIIEEATTEVAAAESEATTPEETGEDEEARILDDAGHANEGNAVTEEQPVQQTTVATIPPASISVLGEEIVSTTEAISEPPIFTPPTADSNDILNNIEIETPDKNNQVVYITDSDVLPTSTVLRSRESADTETQKSVNEIRPENPRPEPRPYNRKFEFIK